MKLDRTIAKIYGPVIEAMKEEGKKQKEIDEWLRLRTASVEEDVSKLSSKKRGEYLTGLEASASLESIQRRTGRLGFGEYEKAAELWKGLKSLEERITGMRIQQPSEVMRKIGSARSNIMAVLCDAAIGEATSLSDASARMRETRLSALRGDSRERYIAHIERLREIDKTVWKGPEISEKGILDERHEREALDALEAAARAIQEYGKCSEYFAIRLRQAYEFVNERKEVAASVRQWFQSQYAKDMGHMDEKTREQFIAQKDSALASVLRNMDKRQAEVFLKKSAKMVKK